MTDAPCSPVREYAWPGATLPHVIECDAPPADPLAWIAAQRERLLATAQRHGAVLLRGFGIDCVAQFREVVAAVTPETMDAYEAPTPRRKVAPDVFTSTEYPAEEAIPLHNEMSHCPRWPDYLWFYCAQQPQQGGETPLADSRQVYERMPEPVRRDFEARGLLYKRIYGTRGDLLDWRTVFRVDTPAELEQYCAGAGLQARWLADGRLVTTRRREATERHPRSGETSWFNQAHIFHPSNLAEDLRAVLAASPEQAAELPYDTAFGDGEPLPPAHLQAVRAAFAACQVLFPWRTGDVLLVDNVLAAHGRQPFAGSRRILVSMARHPGHGPAPA